MSSFRRAVYFAARGILHAVRHERNFRRQLLVMAVVLAVSAVIELSFEAVALILVMSSVVLAAELFNTALEALADMVSTEHHPHIRLVKDCAAAAVLVASGCAVLVGILLLGAALLSRLGQI